MGALLWLGIAPLARRALADDDSDSAARADELIVRGVELRRQGQEQEALATFRAAYALSRSARARGQMGLAAKSLRLYLEAEQCLNEALAAKDDPWVERNRAVLESALSLVGDNLSWLQVETNVQRGTLVINGQDTLALPLARPLRVVAGAARLEVRAEGFRSYSGTHTLLARNATTVRLRLEPNAEPTPPNEPLDAGAEIAPAASNLSSDAGHRSESARDAVQLRPVAYAVGAVGAAALAIGGYFAVRTFEKKSERNEICPDPQCPTTRGIELDHDARRAALYATLSLSGGAAALGVATYLYFRPASTARTGVTQASGARSVRVLITPTRASGVHAALEWDL